MTIKVAILVLKKLFIKYKGSTSASAKTGDKGGMGVAVFRDGVRTGRKCGGWVTTCRGSRPGMRVGLRTIAKGSFNTSVGTGVRSSPPAVFSMNNFSSVGSCKSIVRSISSLSVVRRTLGKAASAFAGSKGMCTVPLCVRNCKFIVGGRVFRSTKISMSSVVGFRNVGTNFSALGRGVSGNRVGSGCPGLRTIVRCPAGRL